MGRPPMPIGSHGKIHTKQLPNKVWEASARFRDHDGTTPRVRRTGRTKTAAENALKKKLVALVTEIRGKEINLDTRFRTIIDLWIEEIELAAQLGDMAEGSVRQFKSYIKNWIKPAFGALQMRELSVLGFESLVDRARDKKSYDTASSIKAVLSLICDYAVRHKALDTNLVRAMKRLSRGDQKEVRALDMNERADLLEKLEKLGQARRTDSLGRDLGLRGKVWTDLPDVVRFLLATGVRIGELAAVIGDNVDVAAKTVRIEAHIVRKQGVGLVRERYRKGSRNILLLQVPTWIMPILIRRKLASGGQGPLFSSWSDTWQDHELLGKRFREAFDEIGYGWVTSHNFRKTVAAVLDEAGLDSGVVADQLGNTRAVAERHYIPPKAANPASAAALEGML